MVKYVACIWRSALSTEPSYHVRRKTTPDFILIFFGERCSDFMAGSYGTNRRVTPLVRSCSRWWGCASVYTPYLCPEQSGSGTNRKLLWIPTTIKWLPGEPSFATSSSKASLSITQAHPLLSIQNSTMARSLLFIHPVLTNQLTYISKTGNRPWTTIARKDVCQGPRITTKTRDRTTIQLGYPRLRVRSFKPDLAASVDKVMEVNYQQFTSNAEHHGTKLSADNSSSKVALQHLDINYYNAILNA